MRLEDHHPPLPGAETVLGIDRIDEQAFIKWSQLSSCIGRHHASGSQCGKYLTAARPPQSRVDSGFAVHIERSNDRNSFGLRSMLVCLQHLREKFLAYTA